MCVVIEAQHLISDETGHRMLRTETTPAHTPCEALTSTSGYPWGVVAGTVAAVDLASSLGTAVVRRADGGRA